MHRELDYYFIVEGPLYQGIQNVPTNFHQDFMSHHVTPGDLAIPADHITSWADESGGAFCTWVVMERRLSTMEIKLVTFQSSKGDGKSALQPEVKVLNQVMWNLGQHLLLHQAYGQTFLIAPPLFVDALMDRLAGF